MWQAIAERGRRRASLSAKFPAALALQAGLRSPAQRLNVFARSIEPKIYGRAGNLEVRLARTWSEIKQAQRLRYQVFYEEMSATPTRLAQFRRRDEDAYDAICDHLLVVDLDETRAGRGGRPERPKVIGTYRILRQDVAERGPGFYSSSEYDIAPLLGAKGRTERFMELGRSCVLAPYRGKRSLELLWHGLWTYVRENRIDVMIGCASFAGTDPDAHKMALSFLHHRALAPVEWRCRAHDRLFVPMDRMPLQDIDTKAVLKTMPPLIKAYLRLGAYVGDGAVIDQQFGTTDVLIIMPVKNIDPRYFEHYGAPAETKSRIAADA
ncbi:ornithine--acyl-ACP N-acyltransferase OlsB [Hyphomicrobium methylovorum]|uniref:GNAT family N-acetyltransferase n=1 Tax=Hyphomicrobium methylovorum TaxID=84 RepID=UPI0015E69F80|nr:GNAT family N-acyltransferase [Hyphomicrobium methylovorum]MBA2126362.1 ornithine--acyl-ACP N-acyltransferase OlsB [Hyphomicrobium methylovorum]